MSFTEDMDTGVAPPASLLKIDVDDVQKTAISFDWLTDRMFRATYSEGALGPTDVDVKTLATHPNFKTALGAFVFPFDKQGLEFAISATALYADPSLEVRITFQTDMDQTITPLPADIDIYANDVRKTPSMVLWQNPREILLAYSEAGLSPDFDVHLPAATDRLRCILGNVLPPFRLDTLPAP